MVNKHCSDITKTLIDSETRVEGMHANVLAALVTVLKVNAHTIVSTYFEMKDNDDLIRCKTLNPTASGQIKKQRLDYYGDRNALDLLGNGPPVTSNREQKCNPLGIKNSGKFVDIVESYRVMFCAQCCVYYCLLHGTEQPQPIVRMDPPEPVTTRNPNGKKSTNGTGSGSISSSTGVAEATANVDYHRYDIYRFGSANNNEITSSKAALLEKLHAVFKSAADSIARALGTRSLEEIVSYLDTISVKYATTDKCSIYAYGNPKRAK